MKIAIEARAITGSTGGVKRYVGELVKGVNEYRSDSFDLSVILDKEKEFNIDGIKKVVVKRWGAIGLQYWLNVQIPGRLEKMGIDLIHYTKADVPSSKRIPTVVTIYDVIPLLYPKSQKFLNKLYWRKALYRAAENSDKIITISETSKKDVVNKLSVTNEKVVVTRLGIDRSRFVFTEKKDKKNPYILYVGTIEPRKNVAGLIKAFNELKNEFPHRLVIVGREYKGHEELKKMADRLGVAERVEWKSDVNDTELIELYRRAVLFVWPSVYEGWGFPPQEAMACGTPVIVSNGGALPEVVGDAGRVVSFSDDNIENRGEDDFFVKELANQMGEVLSNEKVQREMGKRGELQSAMFTWDNVIRTTIDTYKKVLDK